MHTFSELIDNLVKVRYFHGGSDGKASACNVGDLGSTAGWGRSHGEGNGNPLILLLGNFHGWKNLVGYSLRGRKELDVTELLHSLSQKYFNDLKQPFYFVHTFCESEIRTESSEDNLSLLHGIWRFSWKDSKLQVPKLFCFLIHLREGKKNVKKSAALVHLRPWCMC